MRFFSKLTLSMAALTIFVGSVPIARVSASDSSISDAQIELVKSNCATIKNTLNQLHASDGLLRVNRGQIYESMLTKLMDRFNSRLASNNFDNVSMVSTAGQYKNALNNFRSDYKVYEEQLSATLTIDCAKQPVEFYNAIASARGRRLIVHNDIINLNGYIDRYKMDVIQFEKDYNFVADGANY